MSTDDTSQSPWSFDQDTMTALRRSQARMGLDAGDLDAALVEAEELLQDRPDDVEALRVVGQAALAMGDARMAAIAYTRVLEIDATAATDWVGLAVSRFELAELDLALSAAQHASTLSEDLADAWFCEGLVHQRRSDPTKAALAFQRAHVLAPELHPLPVALSSLPWAQALDLGASALPGPLRAFFAGVPIQWACFPDIADLTAVDPPLSPFVGAMYRGEPPEEGDPWLEKPTGVVLFKGNLALPPPTKDELAQRIRDALIQEAIDWLGLSEEEIGAATLGPASPPMGGR